MTRSLPPALRIIACLLICVTLFMCSPIRAEAVALEVVLMYAIPVIAAAIIGLGVMPGTETGEAFNRIVNDCADAMKAGTDFIVDGQIQLAQISNESGRIQYGCTMELIEWVRNWLAGNGIIRTDSILSSGSGVQLVYSENVTDAQKRFWAEIDLYSAAAAASLGQILMLSAGGTSFPTTAYGLQRCSTPYGVDILDVNGTNMALAPYTSANFPVGEFVDLRDFPDTVASLSGSSDYAIAVFLNYEDAVVAYNNPNFSLKKYFYLTQDSYIIPYTTRASSTGFSKVYIGMIANLGCITSGGSVSVANTGIIRGEGYDSFQNFFVPADCAEDEIFESSLGGDGVVGNPDLSISQGYPQWVQDAISDGDVTYLPLGVAPDLDSMSGLTQGDVWTGAAFPAAPIISTQNYSPVVNYQVGERPDPLYAKAYSPDGGTLTYQWYCDGFPIAGQTAVAFYPPTDSIGTHDYTCLVGNFISTSDVGNYSWTWSVRVVVGTAVVPDVPSVTVPLEGAADADTMQDTISDSKTELGTITDSLADASIPDYAGKIDLGFSKIFGSDGKPGPGFVLAAGVLETVFSNDGYIFWVYLFAFTLAVIAFVVFGKRS